MSNHTTHPLVTLALLREYAAWQHERIVANGADDGWTAQDWRDSDQQGLNILGRLVGQLQSRPNPYR